MVDFTGKKELLNFKLLRIYIEATLYFISSSFLSTLFFNEDANFYTILSFSLVISILKICFVFILLLFFFLIL